MIESSEIRELRRNLASYRNHALIGAPKPVAFSFDLELLNERTVDDGVNILKNLKLFDLIVKASGPKPNRFFVSELFTHGAAQLRERLYILGFKLGVYFAYSLGGKIYNYSEIYMAGSQFANQNRYMLNAWHPVRNPNTDIPRAGAKSDAALPSDFMIHDASYLRLKNITLSYTFDLKKKCSWMKDLTLSVSGENLYLWKKYNGFDPDVSSEGTSSTLRRMDLGAYPKPRTIIFSIQLRY